MPEGGIDMGKEIFVKFEVPKELADKIFEFISVAKESGKVRKGTNEVTKNIERGDANLVVLAEDVTPPEIMAHIPMLCDEKKIPYAYVPSREELGKFVGLKVGTASVAVLNPGQGKKLMEEIIKDVESLRK